MADPMTQSSQISSSQGLNDGHSATSKDSKFSDKRVVLGSDKPSEGVATSLRFSSQPSSFSPITYGNESSGPPGGNVDRSFQEKKELFESAHGSQKQDSSPIKVSPVSERIKALEALAAKQNDSEWSDGGIPHFRERHYEKSPTEIQGVSSRSSFKKRNTSNEQDSPESPFEVLGDVRRGSDFEDTADWMRAHLPPAPDFSTEESAFDEAKDSTVTQESPSKEIKGNETEAPEVSDSFVGVPDEFMDTPTQVAQHMDDDCKQTKQDSVEEESEFDLRFLPTAYMWDKQEKSDTDTQDTSCIPGNQDSELPVSPEPSNGFEPPSMPSPTPTLQIDSKQQSSSLVGGSEPMEILEVDSSGESDDTVIEDASGAHQSTDTNLPDSASCIDTVTFSNEQEKRGIQVPIINVIETEEQNISDDEVEPEEEDDDERYQIMHEPAKQAPESSDEHSKGSQPEELPLKEELTSSQIHVAESDGDYSPKQQLICDVSNDSFNQTSIETNDQNLEDSQEQSTMSENIDEPSINVVEPDNSTDMTSHLPPNYDEISNEIESSDIDTYLDHYTNQELALKDQLNSGIFGEHDGGTYDLVKANSLQQNQNNAMFAQQSVEEAIDEADIQLNKNEPNLDLVPDSSPTGISADVFEPLLPQNEMPELEDQFVNEEDQKTTTAPGNWIPLVEEDDYIIQDVGGLSSVQVNTPAPFPSFHNDPSDKISEVISDFVSSGVTDESVITNAVQYDVPDNPTSPEVTDEPEEAECSVTATDSFVEFMRECLKSRQDEEPGSLGPGRTVTDPTSSSTSPPAIIMDLEQERLTICALKELGSSQDEEEETKKASAVSPKEASPPPSKAESTITSISTPQHLPNEYRPETSLAKEVEAIDIWVAEAYHLAEHVLAAILTHLSVYELVHWRDPKKSGVVFGTSLLLLLSLAAFSVISVISYLLLALLCVTITFRIYKSVIQAVQKSSEGHPFKTLMEKDVSVPPETFRKHVDVSLTYINRALKQMSRLFLVEDLVDSLKLAVAMWLLTYVGAVFNGITILILADILLFSVPPLYEKNKTQIDHYLEMARTQINTTVAKLQEKLPGAVKRSKAE